MAPENIKLEGKKLYYNRQFWLLCASSFLFFSSFNMLLPELPGHLANLGGENYKGWIIALFTLTAGLSRPLSGKLTDTIGRIPVMIFGSLVCFVAGMIYPFALSVFTFLLLRLFHGFSTGFKPTATNAYIADLAPPEKRGEAMGVMYFFGSFGMASGPLLGSFLAQTYSVTVMFYVSSFFALASVIVVLGMKETLSDRQPIRLSVFKISRSDVLDPNVFPSAIIIILNVFAFGTIVTIIPDLTTHLGIHNKGLFYTIFTVSSLFIRIIGGKASDKFGRIPVIFISSFLIVIAMILTAFTGNIMMFYLAAIIYGLGLGINTPTAFAWTIDLCDEKQRGRAMATSFIAMEAGIGLGAVIGSYIYNNDPARFFLVFSVAAGISFLSILYLFYYTLHHRKMKRLAAFADESEFENIY